MFNVTAVRVCHRLGNEAVIFAVLRALTMVGGLAGLLIVPLRPEHRVHLTPLLTSFILYKAAVLVALVRWAAQARAIFLATLAADLALVFVLVSFTGGGDSHFYLLFFPLVALNAYHFGAGIGFVSAALAWLLLVAANWLTPPPTLWSHIGARGLLLGLLAVALGHVATRERQARTDAERLNVEVASTRSRLAAAEQLAAVGRLSSKMAHEVRNPLGAINLNVEMLEEIVRTQSGPAMSEARELLRAIREQVWALASLTEEYLVAARLRPPRLEPESVNDVIDDLVRFLSPLVARAGFTLVTDLDEELPPAPLDRALLRQAVHNLVKNSMDVLSPGGHLSIATRSASREAVITITDDGPGVSPEAGRRLFEPFFTTKPGGTGLGLCIAQEIVQQHGGGITWANRPEGGAEFTIRLPLEAHANV